MGKNIHCMIRMDDITPTMNWTTFNQIRNIFETYGIYPLLGVVPDNRDEKLNVEPANEQFWSVLKELELQGWMIAQHGTYHRYVTKQSGILGLKNARLIY